MKTQVIGELIYLTPLEMFCVFCDDISEGEQQIYTQKSSRHLTAYT